jgi:hypothetical protein
MTVRDGQPEVFRPTWAQTWQLNLRPWLPVNIVILLLTWVIGYVVAGPVGSVVIPVVLIAAIVALSRYASRSQGLRVSGYGVELLRRDGGIVRMRWPDIEQVAVVAQRGRSIVAPYGVARAAAGASMSAYVAANTGPGLLGRGESLTPAEVEQQRRHGPGWLRYRETLDQFGLRLVVIDRDWQNGSIGEWVRAYRPDLLPPVPSPATQS